MTTMTALAPFTISSALEWAIAHLMAVTDVVELEAEILLAHVLRASRTHLHAWPDRLLSESEQTHYSQFVKRRLEGEPIAYVTGKREFWSLELTVTPDTLIPRPETEILVELALSKLNDDEIKTIADLGTGSGAIALALASERPGWVVHATDRVAATLQVAKANAVRLDLAHVKFHEGSWCEALPKLSFDAIISNPPYIAEGDPQLNQQVLLTEPRAALLSGEDGLLDIRRIIQEARSYLKSGGYLLLEHGARQAEAVKSLMQQAGYVQIESYQDLAGLDRATIGQFQSVTIAS
ncbi:MAG: peptide chain release factor N(5)-glutamine methyltransferase [Gammaproteobacteria bacterium]|nr:peptide chain release factor N(5)-glutamine methyltransferase [Gammaproteobacteria bacterium]